MKLPTNFAKTNEARHCSRYTELYCFVLCICCTALHRTTGKYRLEGSQRRRCVGGHFDGEETRCVGLNQKYDYKIDQVIDIMSRRMVT